MASLTGRVVGRWTLGDFVSKGSVVRVAHNAHGERAAVKVLDKRHLGPTDRELIRHQIKLLRSLRGHDNIINLVDVHETEEELFLVYEHIRQGEELLEFLQARKRLTEEEARIIFAQVAAAVAHLHAKNIAHRDLKLPVLLFDARRHVVKITDFTFAISVAQGQLICDQRGSPAYVSPEILSAQPYDPYKADVWAMGVVLYALLAGTYPFADTDPQRLFARIAAGRYDPPPGTSREVRALLAQMLCVDPNARISAADIVAHPWTKAALACIGNDQVVPDVCAQDCVPVSCK
eukprot:Opistho-1_new@28330